MILLKLGGSVITDKGNPVTPRRQAIRSIAEALSGLDEPMIIVHGGGSYGHYWSVVYDIHTKPGRYDPRGVAIVKNSMVKLNDIVLDSLTEGGLRPYSLPPAALFRSDTIVAESAAEARDIAESGMTPVTYGDVLWRGDQTTYILSGDAIMGRLAHLLKPRLCIFATDVDGLYRDLKDGRPVDVVDDHNFRISEVKMDVTGGMRRKVDEAAGIAGHVCDVLFLNGNKPGRISSAVRDCTFHGTLFKRR